MPNRFTVKQRSTIYKFLVQRDGEYCLICHKKPQKGKTLEIDHADNNPANFDPENLHLLCGKCNLSLRALTKRQHIERIRYYGALRESEREREKASEKANSFMVREMVDLENSSPELLINSYCEGTFIDWLFETLDHHEFMERKEVINSGAHVANCSPITTKRYLDKLISFEGPLTEEKINGLTVIRRK